MVFMVRSLYPTTNYSHDLCFLFIRLAGEQHRRSLLGWPRTIAARVTPRFILSTHSYTNPCQTPSTIAATSCFHHHTNHNKVQSQPLDHLPAVTVPPMIVYEDVNTLSEMSTVLYEVENLIIDDEPVVVDDKEVLVVNEAEDIHEVTRSTWQSPMEKV
nr:hypothetical protein CTI12_AA402100 [Tanacetum cinerariifolium]